MYIYIYIYVMLFQSSFAKYFLISLYLPLWKFPLYVFFYFYVPILLRYQNVFDYDHCYPIVHVFSII